MNNHIVCFDPCGHNCCKECYKNIEKCHICRKEIVKK